MERLQVALLSVLSSVPRPAGASLDWLLPTSSIVSLFSPGALQTLIREQGADDAVDTVETRYIELQRSLYRLANSTAILPFVSGHIIKSQLANIGEDALKFLASLWLDQTKASFEASQLAALRHAAAFLEAHYASQRFVDFQVVLPAILVAMSQSDRRIREAAFECIAALIRLSQSKKPASIYAFDKIYGASSGEPIRNSSGRPISYRSKLTYSTWTGLTFVDTYRCCSRRALMC